MGRPANHKTRRPMERRQGLFLMFLIALIILCRFSIEVKETPKKSTNDEQTEDDKSVGVVGFGSLVCHRIKFPSPSNKEYF